MGAVKAMAKDGKLGESLVFLFTDNSVVENTVAKGNSPVQALFLLVLELCRVQMRIGFMLHVIHVSGLCMIEQGTDGVS